MTPKGVKQRNHLRNNYTAEFCEIICHPLNINGYAPLGKKSEFMYLHLAFPPPPFTSM